MMRRTPSLFLMLLGVLVLLLATVPFSAMQLQSAVDTNLRSQSSLRESQKLCASIREVKDQLIPDSREALGQEAVLSRVRKGMTSIKLDESLMTDLRIIGKSQIQRTNFSRDDSAVTFRSISLRELFAFIATQELPGGMICSGIDLRVSKQSINSDLERWDATLTLTQLSKNATSPKNR